MIARLRTSGCEVELTRRAEHFGRLHVITGEGVQLDVDLGVDWRRDEPVRLAVGPVLTLDDAVGSKFGALYSRGEVRDYLDVDAIRRSGRFSDEQLLTAAADRDPGFRLDMFLWRLDGARRISQDDVDRYGVSADQLVALQARYDLLATDLRAQVAVGTSGVGAADEIPDDQVIRERRANPARMESEATGQPSGTRPSPPSASRPGPTPHPPGQGPSR